MSIADKLTQIAENEQRVYESGKSKANQIINSIVDRTITELNCDAESLGRNCFAYCDKLVKAKAPFTTYVYNSAFYGCTSLERFDVSNSSKNFLYIFAGSFSSASALKLVVLRTNAVATLQATSAFTDCPLMQGNGLILVPERFITQYNATTNWSAIPSQIRPIEMYTVDGTTTGELDEEALTAFFNTLG